MRETFKNIYDKAIASVLDRTFIRNLVYREPLVRDIFFRRLISHTQNFGTITWLGKPIWQNVLDLWVIQETIAQIEPDLLIECGTNRGGSAYFYAQLFDLMGKGRVISIDIEKMHNCSHPRATFLIGSSTSDSVVEQVRQEADKTSGEIMVILDSDHSEQHVLRELEIYTPFVTLNSYCLVQDGIIDVIDSFAAGRPGPLSAIKLFLAGNRNFVVDGDKCNRFLITHHPSGWLKRIA